MNIADQVEESLRETLNTSTAAQWVIGAGIEIDPYWLVAEMAYHVYRYFDRRFDYYTPHDFWERLQNDRIPGNFDWLRAYRRVVGQQTDLSFRPVDWDRHCSYMGYPENASPVIIKVYLNDKIANERSRELPAALFQQYPIQYEFRKILNSYAGTLGGPASYFKRLIERKKKQRGVTLERDGTNITGTLGGFLRGQYSGNIYMVTCAHVAGEQNSDVSARLRRLRRPLGKVSFSVMPPTIEGDNKCSQTYMPGERSVDLSLIKLLGVVDDLSNYGIIPTVHSTLTEKQVNQGDPVYFVGKESGRVEARIGALDIWHQGMSNGRLHCYRRLVELTSPDDFQYIMTNLAKEGDSGSWVLDNLTGGNRWVGMIVASERSKAFMCLAETILNHCERVEPLIGVSPDWNLR